MLYGVGRAPGLLCLLLFMLLDRNGLRKVSTAPQAGTELSMARRRWGVEDALSGPKGHHADTGVSCRGAAQSNAQLDILPEMAEYHVGKASALDPPPRQ